MTEDQIQRLKEIEHLQKNITRKDENAKNNSSINMLANIINKDNNEEEYKFRRECTEPIKLIDLNPQTPQLNQQYLQNHQLYPVQITPDLGNKINLDNTTQQMHIPNIQINPQLVYNHFNQAPNQTQQLFYATHNFPNQVNLNYNQPKNNTNVNFPNNYGDQMQLPQTLNPYLFQINFPFQYQQTQQGSMNSTANINQNDFNQQNNELGNSISNPSNHAELIYAHYLTKDRNNDKAELEKEYDKVIDISKNLLFYKNFLLNRC